MYIQTETETGSDSAPHPVQSKEQAGGAAGWFTQGWCTALVIGELKHGMNQAWISEKEVTRAGIERFLSIYGRTFY